MKLGNVIRVDIAVIEKQWEEASQLTTSMQNAMRNDKKQKVIREMKGSVINTYVKHVTNAEEGAQANAVWEEGCKRQARSSRAKIAEEAARYLAKHHWGRDAEERWRDIATSNITEVPKPCDLGPITKLVKSYNH